MPKFGTHSNRLRHMLSNALSAASPTQADLARAAGISYHALRQYRKGERTPSPAVVRRIAQALRAQAERLTRMAGDLEAAERPPERRRR